MIKKPLQPISQQGPINSLTGLRFWAAVAVVFFHYGKQHVVHLPGFVRNIAGGGANGVALFFILSGFVLAYNYTGPAKIGSLDKAEFWKARFARIYPVYLLSLVLTLNRFSSYLHSLLPPFSLSRIFQASTSFAMAVTLTQAWDINRADIWNFPAWTLSVEMLFYLAFPWACAAVCRLKPSRLLPAVYGLIVISVGIKAIYLALHPGVLGTTPSRNDFWIWAISAFPPMRLPEFLIGVVLGRMYLVRPELRIKHRSTVSILAVTGIMAVLALGVQPGIFTTALLVPLFVLLIYTLASGPGIVSGFLSMPILVLLGNASYAIYILQVPVMTAANKVLGAYGVTFWAGLAALIGISTATYLYFEAPARKWLRRRWADRNETTRAAMARA